MASFDYDVVIIGSGFGGSVAATGAVISGPATEPLRVYEAQEIDGDIQIRA